MENKMFPTFHKPSKFRPKTNSLFLFVCVIVVDCIEYEEEHV